MTLDIRSDKQMANLLGVVFLAVMVLGFIPNPLVAPEGVFAVNAIHNLVHGLAGVLLLLGARAGYAQKTIIVVGAIYLIVAVLGYMMPGDMVLGLIKINAADNYLHLLLGVVILFAGAYVKPSKV